MSSLFHAPITISNIVRPAHLFVWDVTSDGTVVAAPSNVSSALFNHAQQSSDPSNRTQPRYANENRRLYVGSMDYSIQEDMIREIFKCFGSIERIEMPKESSGQSRGYCFIEFHSPDSVIDALSVMNNYNFVGRPLKVRFPSNVPQEHGVVLEQHAKLPHVQLKWDAAVKRGIELNLYVQQAASHPAASAQTAQPQQVERRIYVGSIDFQVTQEDIMELFAPFGTIVHMNMVMNPDTGKHRGFGFIEFETQESAEAAIGAMDGQVLIDRKMIVRHANPSGANSGGSAGAAQAVPPPPPPGSGPSLPPPTASSTSTENSGAQVPLQLDLDDLDEIDDPMSGFYPSLPPIPNPLQSMKPTPIVCLHRILTPEQFRAENMSTFRDDLHLELSKFGTVLEISPVLGSDNKVKVFVRYSDIMGSQKASIALKNRLFDSQQIPQITFATSIPQM